MDSKILRSEKNSLLFTLEIRRNQIKNEWRWLTRRFEKNSLDSYLHLPLKYLPFATWNREKNGI